MTGAGWRRLALAWAVVLLVAAGSARATAPIAYDIAVRLDPSGGTLLVDGTAEVPAGEALDWGLDARHRVEAMTLDGRPLAADPELRDGQRVWRLPAARTGTRRIGFRYRGEIAPLPEAADHRAVLGLKQPIAGTEGSWLPAGAGWYPQADGVPVTWRLRVAVPKGQRGVAAGRILREEDAGDAHVAEFEQAAPVLGIDLYAGPYTMRERVIEAGGGRRIAVRTWFHAELAELADDYIAAAAEHLLRYDREIGPYPFASYAIVSSPLPAGFGMPGIAWLGRDVLRLPFIRATSLRHEVLHNWWGNGVFVDAARGNWSEGLTTFMADYARREAEGPQAARAMRMGWLRDYAAIAPSQDIPLSRFVARRHGAEQAIGYNKAAFLFFMLREGLGESAFSAGLRRFYAEQRFAVADWDALRRAFEAETGGALAPWFAQWLERAGAPELGVERARRLGGGTRLELVLRQSEPPYRLSVPVRVLLERGTPVQTRVETAAASTRVEIAVPAPATGVLLDPDLRLFRRLHPAEVVPILRDVLVAPAAHHVAVGAGADAVVRMLAQAVLDHPAGASRGRAEPDAGPRLVAGLHADVAAWLARNGISGPPAPLAGRTEAHAWAARGRGGEALVVVSAPDLEALGLLRRSLPHLGAQSWAVFRGGRSVERGVWPMRTPVHPVDG